MSKTDKPIKKTISVRVHANLYTFAQDRYHIPTLLEEAMLAGLRYKGFTEAQLDAVMDCSYLAPKGLSIKSIFSGHVDEAARLEKSIGEAE